MRSSSRGVRTTVAGLATALLGLSVLTGATGPAQAKMYVGPAAGSTETVTSSASDLTPADTVVAVSIDALQSRTIRELGPERTPVLHRLIAEGASTLNARTVREQTDTLPNHTSMLTGLRIDADRRGHGVTWNDDRLDPPTVHDSAGRPVDSVFGPVSAAGGSTALFASKTKFALFERSWDPSVDRFTIREHNGKLVTRAVADLAERTRAFRFVHLSLPDKVGHRYGFTSAEYDRAVERSDALLGRLVAGIEGLGPDARAVLVVTADHGGTSGSHRDPTKLHNYRVPFVVWGTGVARGADLYALNDDYANPGRARTGYRTSPPPVRNASLANLVTDLLGLGPVPGSGINTDQDLDVH